MPTQPTTIKAADSKMRRAALESKLKELVDVFRERDELRIEYQADPIDQLTSRTDREMAVQRFDQQTRLIHDIQSALAKIEEGTYGICERCESPILRKRLDAVPWASLCVRCQTEAEAAGRHQIAAFEEAA